MDQRGLVERARGGDHDAFTALVDRVLARLDLAARLILRDPDLARDAVQEALIRAWRYLPGLRDPDAFDGWLHRLTVNACLDLAQHRKRRLIEMDIALIETPSRSDMAGDLANRDQLNDALGSLDPKHRAVVVMHFFLGMPLIDVAAALRIPVGTAKSRLHYSLATMRASIAAEPTPTRGTLAGGRPA